MVLGLALVLFALGRWRYDLVALAALLVLVVADIVPAQEAFTGFGHPAVVTVAAVLVISKGLQNSGAVEFLTRWVSQGSQAVPAQLGRLTGLAAGLSGFINNVASMALMMPVAIRAARRGGRTPSLFLMPLAFSTLLGGLMTLIGTPPNIIVSTFRDEAGDPFGMFAFTPVGLGVSVAGVLFLTLIGWRFIPQRQGQASPEDLFKIDDYITEVQVDDGSPMVGRTVYELETSDEDDQESGGFTVVGLVRDGLRVAAPPSYQVLQSRDILIIEASPEAIAELTESSGLSLVETTQTDELSTSPEEETVVEAIVPYETRLIGRTSSEVGLRWQYGVNVLAIARQGQRLPERPSLAQFKAGDILLLQGAANAVNNVLNTFGCLPLAERGLRLGRPRRLLLTLGIFVSGVAVTTSGVLPAHVALTATAVAMVVTGLLSPSEAYDSIEWPIIILIGAMIPVGLAMEETGATSVMADKLLELSSGFPPEVIVVQVMVAAILLSAVVNNAATAVAMAPLAFSAADGLNVSADPFLMAVAVGASSAFLTPIGHQSNTMAWGPGGYKFSDYWRVGLPLEILLVGVATPLILLVWPL